MTLSILNMARLTAWIQYRLQEGVRNADINEALPAIFPDVPPADFAEFHGAMAQAYHEVADFWEKRAQEFEQRSVEMLEQERMRLGITVIDGGKK